MSTIIQRSFSGGELAPALQTRVDQTKYEAGLKTCRNMMVMRHGGATSRPGTIFVAEVKDSNVGVKLVPFVYSTTDSYMLEFGHLYMRVMKNGVRLTVSPSAWSVATNYAVTDLVVQGGVNYYCISPCLGAGATPPNATYWYPLTSNIYEIPTVYTSSEVSAIKYAQNANVMTIVHPSHPPQELLRFGDLQWTIASVVFGFGISAPGSVSTTGNTAGGLNFNYNVTAVRDDNGEESLGKAVAFGGQSALSPTNPIRLYALSVSGAKSFNIYRQPDGSGSAGDFFGYIGSVAANPSAGVGFYDIGFEPDVTKQPPVARNPFSSANNYPSIVAYSQQRLILGSTNNKPLTVWASRTGAYKNFSVSTTSQDDDAVTFTLTGKQVNALSNIIDVGTLFLFTSGAEIVAQGDQNGLLKPSSVNLKTQGNLGSNSLLPLSCEGNVLFVQARGTIVRDLFFQFQIDAYRGNDVSIFAPHLFEGFTLSDWAYQQIPHSIVWAVRSDGTLLGLTYVKEQQIVAWHHHDFQGGTVENVATIPESSEDSVYVVVKRTMNGVTKRYIERMASRFLDTSSIDYIGMDCSLAYDGRNTGSTTMVITGGSTWDYTDTLTLTASSSYFVVGDVGKVIVITYPDGAICRFTISAYTSATVVTGHPDRTVTVSQRGGASRSWSKAVNTVTGLSHLVDGQTVSVLADGFVVGSPNNSAYATYTVSGGSVTLDQCYSVIRVGLPITCDLQTLDVDTAQGESIVNKSKLPTELTVYLEKSRGLFAGFQAPSDNSTTGLSELKVREYESYDSPTDLLTGPQTITIAPTWNSNGRVFLRQVDPLPLTVLSVAVDGLFPFKNGGS